MIRKTLTKALSLAILAIGFSLSGAETLSVVQEGKAPAAHYAGAAWKALDGGLVAEGTGRILYAKQALGAGDFHITAKLKLERLEGTAAAFVLGDSFVGFDGGGKTLFVEGPLFGGATRKLESAEPRIKPNEFFIFEAIREKETTRFLIDGKEIQRLEKWTGPVGEIGLRPHRNQMTVAQFQVQGELVVPPALLPPVGEFLFVSGQDGYHTYRIPALAVTTKGTVLAICEGRKDSWGDSGNIDLVVKRSTDNGKTWSAQHVIWDDQGNTCGNPCVVVDRETGAVWLFSTWNRGDDHEGAIIAQKSKDTRRVFVIGSTDDGLTWSKPTEVTKDAKLADWTWYATGPGSGIQIENGPHKGRLVIPCDHIEAQSKKYFSHIIYSDDHGKSWKLGGSTPQDKVNECEVVELEGGKLMLNMRNYDRSLKKRQVAISDDGGLTWKDQRHDEALIEPICQAGIERYRWAAQGKPGVIVFSNPASERGRVAMTVRASYDDGRTWPVSRLLYAGPGGYSDLAVLANGEIACFYEGGPNNIAENIIFARLPLESLAPVAAATSAQKPVPATLVLKADDFRHYVESFNKNDNELYKQYIPNAQAWDFLKANVPLLDCPDQELAEIYYFRWWTYRKHLKQTPDGFIITEFLPSVGWAGKHNSINCAAGHHFMEGRWLADPKYLDDYAIFWLRKGGTINGPRSYTWWPAWAIRERHAVTGQPGWAYQLLDDLVANYRTWERGWPNGGRSQAGGNANGMFFTFDGNDGGEVSIGGHGYRPLINAAMYGEATAIAALAAESGRGELAAEFTAKAARLKELIQTRTWDPQKQFFMILQADDKTLTDCRELYGYAPWYFNLPDAPYAVAWKQLMDPQGFYAPFGPSFAEQRHPKFTVAYQGHECQWNGPSWPYSTSVTLTALANLLNGPAQDAIGKADYWKTFQCYLRSHRFREIPPGPGDLRKSHDNAVPRHTWWAQDRLGGSEWVQYEFKTPVTVDATEVFWYYDDAGIDPPASWRLLARDGAGWREIQAKGPYASQLDRYNRVEFAPVTTTALRLEAVTAKGKSAGILEWRVCQGGKNLAGEATPSASYSDIYAARLGALNDGTRPPQRLETQQPWIDENLNPFNGDWIARTLLRQRGQKPEERGKDYNHSTFCDLVISGLVGLRPRTDDMVEVNPLIPEGTWDYFCLDQVRYHGHWLTILYDKSGQRYGKGKGLRVFCDGQEIATRETLGRVTGRLAGTPPGNGAGKIPDLAVQATGEIACFYEGGPNHIAENIIFASLPLESLAPPAAGNQAPPTLVR